MDKKELIKTIQAIIGNKTFEFSEAYVKKSGNVPTIGKSERPYWGVTKKYVYIECYAVYTYNNEAEQYGYDIRKYPIFYRKGEGIFAHKIELKDLFTTDLEKILKDIQFFLWWENNVHKTEIQKELDKCESYSKAYSKMVKLVGVPE